MASLYLQLNNTVLQWVLEQAQSLMAPDEIVERLSDWIAGRKKPTFSQVENMSRKIHIPFGYFFLDKPPVEDNKIAEFRTGCKRLAWRDVIYGCLSSDQY